MTSKASHLAGYVEVVVAELADELDPSEVRYPDYASLGDLRADLTTVIEGAVADWEIEQREQYGPREPDPDRAYDEKRDREMLGIDVPDGAGP